ncbi:hypothetical protein ONZ45_g15956 [Pleurotus djamor]|nr:hypothetical protein ONZ45_g15956 [Pleurotus djamor]
MITPTSLVVLSSAALLLAFCRPKNRTRVPLPPGPKKLPIIGSLLVAPMEYQWVKYSEWSKEYGSDVIYLEVAGNSIVVLHSLESITEILNRRSAINPSSHHQSCFSSSSSSSLFFVFFAVSSNHLAATLAYYKQQQQEVYVYLFFKDDEITVLMQLPSPQPEDPLDPSGSSSWMQTQANGLYLGLKRPVMTRRSSSTGGSRKEYTYHVVAEDVHHNGNATKIIQLAFLVVVFVVEQAGNGINNEQPQSSYTITTAFKLPFPTPTTIIFIPITFITITFSVKNAAATVFDPTTSEHEDTSASTVAVVFAVQDPVGFITSLASGSQTTAYANVAEGSPLPAGRGIGSSDAVAGRDGWEKVDNRLREAQHLSSRKGFRSRSPSLLRTQSKASTSQANSSTTSYTTSHTTMTEEAAPAFDFVRKTESPIHMDKMPLTGVEAALAALTGGQDGKEEEEVRKEMVDEGSLPNPFITHTRSDSSSSSPSPPPPPFKYGYETNQSTHPLNPFSHLLAQPVLSFSFFNRIR